MKTSPAVSQQGPRAYFVAKFIAPSAKSDVGPITMGLDPRLQMVLDMVEIQEELAASAKAAQKDIKKLIKNDVIQGAVEIGGGYHPGNYFSTGYELSPTGVVIVGAPGVPAKTVLEALKGVDTLENIKKLSAAKAEKLAFPES